MTAASPTASATGVESIEKTVARFIEALPASPDAWERKPDRRSWSSPQVVEHVARSLEGAAAEILDLPSPMLSLPAPLRFVVRNIMMRGVLRSGRFPKARTNAGMNPSTGPGTPEAAVRRLTDALESLRAACLRRAAPGATVHSKVFGSVPLRDYLRFQELHVRHHQKQLDRSGATVTSAENDQSPRRAR